MHVRSTGFVFRFQWRHKKEEQIGTVEVYIINDHVPLQEKKLIMIMFHVCNIA